MKMYIMNNKEYVDILDIAGMTTWYGYKSYQDGEKFIIENGEDRKEIIGSDISHKLEHLNELDELEFMVPGEDYSPW